MKKYPRIYVGSPLRPQAGDPGWPRDVRIENVPPAIADSYYAHALAANTHHAEQVCKAVALAGGIPYAPHLLFPRFFDDREATERDLSIEYGLVELSTRDEAWFVLPHWRLAPSNGMNGEIEAAHGFGVPVRVMHDTASLRIQLDRLTAGEVLRRVA